MCRPPNTIISRVLQNFCEKGPGSGKLARRCSNPSVNAGWGARGGLDGWEVLWDFTCLGCFGERRELSYGICGTASRRHAAFGRRRLISFQWAGFGARGAMGRGVLNDVGGGGQATWRGYRDRDFVRLIFIDARVFGRDRKWKTSGKRSYLIAPE